MDQKTFNLITAIIGGVEAIAVAMVTFFKPSCSAAINGAIVISGTAINEILTLFVKKGD